MPDLSKTLAFIREVQAHACVAVVMVAVGVPESIKNSDSVSMESLPTLVMKLRGAVYEASDITVSVEVVPVAPWGKFVPALNALVSRSVGYDFILFASVEVKLSSKAMKGLLDVMVRFPEALVAGAALPGHDFQKGSEVPVSGMTAPWNTLALWRMSHLGLMGFPLVAEGLYADGGVEEVSAIEALRRVAPQKSKAFLIKLSDVNWQTTFDDPKRQEWHTRKMASKVTPTASSLILFSQGTRAAAHLALLGDAPSGTLATVAHMDLTSP